MGKYVKIAYDIRIKVGVFMSFKEEIEFFENLSIKDSYILKLGNIPILFTAPHTMVQFFGDGSIKLNEPYTKAIAIYLNKYYNTSYFVKVKDNGIDSNKDNHDEFKENLIKIVKDNNIKLVIDLHGASKNRNFDIEFGTLNNLSADYSTIKELEEAFLENDILNIKHNNPFKGGAITQYLYKINDVDVIQLEINKDFRDLNKIENLERLCNALGSFIKQYASYIER